MANARSTRSWCSQLARAAVAVGAASTAGCAPEAELDAPGFDNEKVADEAGSIGVSVRPLTIDNGLLLRNGVRVSNGQQVLNGYTMPNGTRLSNGLTLNNSIRLSNGITMSNGLQVSNGVSLKNGLPMANGFKLSNGVVLKEVVSATTGYIAPAQGSDLDSWISDSPDNAIKTLQYLIQCALTPADQVYVQWRDRPPATYTGIVGLAPEWRDGEMSELGRKQASACMLARINAAGKQINIELLANRDGLNTGVRLESDPLCKGAKIDPEAAFFGDLFADPPIAYMCRSKMADFFNATRACGTDKCADDLIKDVGYCEDMCAFRDGPDSGSQGDFFDDCTFNGQTWSRGSVVTAWRDYCGSDRVFNGDGVTVNGISDWKHFAVNVPANVGFFARVEEFSEPGSNLLHLYLRRGAKPTTTYYDARDRDGWRRDRYFPPEANAGGIWYISLVGQGTGKLKVDLQLSPPPDWTKNTWFTVNRTCFGPGDLMAFTHFRPTNAGLDWWSFRQDGDRWGYTGDEALLTQTIPVPTVVGTYDFDYYQNDSDTLRASTKITVSNACASSASHYIRGTPVEATTFKLDKNCYEPSEYIQMTVKSYYNSSDKWYVYPYGYRNNYDDGGTYITSNGKVAYVPAPHAIGKYTFRFARGNGSSEYRDFEVRSDCSPTVPTVAP